MTIQRNGNHRPCFPFTICASEQPITATSSSLNRKFVPRNHHSSRLTSPSPPVSLTMQPAPQSVNQNLSQQNPRTYHIQALLAGTLSGWTGAVAAAATIAGTFGGCQSASLQERRKGKRRIIIEWRLRRRSARANLLMLLFCW